jgi:hypothetical protein
MSLLVSTSKSYLAITQARDALLKADPRDFKQEWVKGKEEFHLRASGNTEYVIARHLASKADLMYSIRLRCFNREESLSIRFGDSLHNQLRESFNTIADLRVAQRQLVREAVEVGALLHHVRQRDFYTVSHSQKGTLFTSELPDTGSGAVVVRGDVSRDVSHPDKKLILEVTWRSAAGTGGPLAFVVDPRYAALLEPKR